MDLPEIIVQSGLTGLDGVELSLAANEHLFRWPGELVYGGLSAFAGATPETIQPEDWRYRRLDNPDGNERAKQRSPAPENAPDIDIQSLRDREWDWIDSSAAEKPIEDISRPTMAGAFEQRLLAQDVYNPFLAEYPMRAIELSIQSSPQPFEPQHHAGAQWVVDWLCLQIMATKVMSPEVVTAIGAYNSGVVCCGYLLANASYLGVASSASSLESFLEKAAEGVDAKLASIKAEISVWASFGRAPVEQPNGTPDMLLSAVDAITATIAIYNLARLAAYLQDWMRGARHALEGVQSEL